MRLSAPSAYRKAGVDIEGADNWLARMRPVVRATWSKGVLRDKGQFAGLFSLSHLKLRDPVLVSSTDGAGTKLKLARSPSDHEVIGVDVVAMNTNDVLVYGARPVLFLDYMAVGRLESVLMSALLRGIAKGCRLSGCALIGGETAEMPGVYDAGEYDVAGFCVGVAERSRLIDGSRVRAGDVVVGLASSGVHANGFSLVRKALSSAQLERLKKQLMVPTRIYVKPVLDAIKRFSIHGIAHVTGGGLARRLPSLVSSTRGLRVHWEPGSWRVPPVFQAIREAGNIPMDEMMRTFNMGIGMVLAVPADDAGRLVQRMSRSGIPAWPIGRVERAA